jgi:hypothetical protein
MSPNLLLIDDLGILWDGGSSRLRSSYGTPAAGDDFSTYVVKNLGFIAVHGYGRSCEIRLRPQVATPAAFDALRDWLKGRAFDRIVTAHYEQDWVYGLHGNRDAATARLENVLAQSRAPRPGDYLTRNVAPDDLGTTTPLHRALSSLVKNWPMLSQSVHRDGLAQIITSLKGRYHLVDAHDGQRDLTFREIGPGFISYSDDWVARAVGTSIEDQEDKAYGRWVAKNYREVLAHGRPTVCDVDTIMMTPRLGRARVRYKRVLLPARDVGGGTWLFNSSIIDPSIDLRADLLEKRA